MEDLVVGESHQVLSSTEVSASGGLEKCLDLRDLSLSESVIKTLSYFSRRALWFNVTRNRNGVEVRSCREAAHNRVRLGHAGIPLRDELKTYFAYVDAPGKGRMYVSLNSRGDRSLDWSKVQRTLCSSNGATRLEDDELSGIFGMTYGLVNPFAIDESFAMAHVFDNGVIDRHQPPFTMMTNAGDLRLGVEFKPIDVIHKMGNRVIVSDIAADQHVSAENTRDHKIGILTGNSPDSGICLWQRINEEIRDRVGSDFCGDVSLPPVVIESLPAMGLSMELDLREAETRETVLTGIESLCRQGATVTCIACNTTQYFVPEILAICNKYNVHFVSMIEPTLAYLRRNGIDEFAFLGIKYVSGLGRWSAYRELSKYKVEIPSEQALQQIHKTGFRVKQEGVTSKVINELRDLLNRSTKSKNIVVALTELSIPLRAQRQASERKGRQQSDRNYIDTLELLAEAVADKYLSLAYPEFREETSEASTPAVSN